MRLIDDCRALARMGFWPRVPLRSDPARWLANFTEAELPIANALLESFVYIPEEVTIQLLVSAFRGVASRLTGTRFEEASYSNTALGSFRSEVLVTFPTGENPNPVDSGHLLVRWARDFLGLHEEQIVEPEKVVSVWARNPHRPLVIIDDFAGSGDQFVTTWQRQYPCGAGTDSLASLAARVNAMTFYVAPVVTWRAADRLLTDAPGVRISPGHLLSARYSALHPNSVVTPPELRPYVRDVIEAASLRGGIPRQFWFGWKELGLALAFSHTKTDGSLGLFWKETDTWAALINNE